MACNTNSSYNFWWRVFIFEQNDKIWLCTDLPKALKLTLFTISMCCSRKKGFRHLFTFIIKALTYTYVPSTLANFTHSASIVWNRKTQRSLVRGRGTSIDDNEGFRLLLWPCNIFRQKAISNILKFCLTYVTRTSLSFSDEVCSYLGQKLPMVCRL